MEPTLPFSIQDGRFEVVAEIGRGAHATVYRARDARLDHDVAVKMLRADAADRTLIGRFEREIAITSSLEHPRIASVIASGEWNGRLYFVSELAVHASLDARLRRDGQLPVEDALQIAYDVLDALDYAHRRGVIHRDIKPENILLSDGGAVVADFGIARAVGIAVEHAVMTSTGIAVGTLLYMSPEQICAEGDIDGRSDQYSVALMLYEMLTGVRPHAAATVEGLRALRIAGHQHSVQAHRPMVPDYVNRAVMRAMSSSPADRFVDCGAFGRALRGDGVSAQAPAGVVKGTSSRRRVMGYAGAAVVLLLVGVAASMDLLQEPAGSAPVEAASMAPQPIRVVLLPGDDDATGTAQRVAQSLRTELTSWARVSVLDSSTSSYERARKDKRSELADVVEISALPGAADSSRALIRVVREDSTSEELLTPFAFRTADGPTPQVMKLVAMQIIGGRRATQDSSPGIETISRPDRVALSRFVRAWDVLRDGQLDSAVALFRAASGSSPNFAAAHFRTAQTLSWISPGDVNAWRSDAERVLPFAAALGSVDSLNAVALFALAQQRFPEACATYREALRLAPRSFEALFGLGECQRLDRAVVPDRKSPTQFRFRSNHLETLRAYTNALDAIPSAKLGRLFENVPGVTLASLQLARQGKSSSPERSFTGLPSREGDSAVVWPQPTDRVTNSESGTLPDSYMYAVRYGRTLFVEFARRWTRNANESHAAHMGLALSLELTGNYDEALQALDVANRLSSRTSDSIKVAVSKSRLRLRSGEMAMVTKEATAGLALRSSNLPVASLSRLASLAAVLGRGNELSTLAQEIGGSEGGRMPVGLRPYYGAAYSSAMLRECGSAPARIAALDSALRTFVSPAEFATLRLSWVAPAARMAATCDVEAIVPFLGHDLPFDRAVRAISQNDSVRARSILDSLVSRRRGASASAVAWDFEFAETSLLLQIGDTARVIRRLENALSDLASMSEYTFDYPEHAAGLRQGILLIASLTRVSAQHRSSSKWQGWARDLRE